MKRSRWLLLGIVAMFTVALLAAPASAAKALSFVTQPSDAVKNQTITNIALDAVDGTIDGSVVQVLAASNSRVTLSSVPSGASQTVRAGADGIASFPNFSIGTPGTYTLVATANGFDATPASNSFRVFGAGEACSGGAVCDPETGTLLNKGQTSKAAGASSGGGVVGIGQDIESAPVCEGDGPQFNHGPSVVSTYWNNIDGEVVVTVLISKAWDQLQSNNGASFYQFCLELDPNLGKTFTDRLSGQQVTTGLVSDCGPRQEPACVQSRNKDKKGNVQLVLRLDGDAKCR